MPRSAESPPEPPNELLRELMDDAEQMVGDEPEKLDLLAWLLEHGTRQLGLAQNGLVAIEAKLDRLGTLGTTLLAVSITMLGLPHALQGLPWWVPIVGIASAACFAVATAIGLTGNAPRPLREIGYAERWAIEYLPWASATRTRYELLFDMAEARRLQEGDSRQLARSCRRAFRALACGLLLGAFAVLAAACLRS